MRRLPTLDDVRIASPCSADWNAMVGDDRVRFCGSCEKHVYNLSAMLAHEAEQLLAERLGGEMCVRFYQRADGTMMTQDCPVGVRKKQRKKLALAVAGAGALVAAAATALLHRESMTGKLGMTPCGSGEIAHGGAEEGAGQHMMGDIAPAIMGTASAVPLAPPPPVVQQPAAPHPGEMVMGRRSIAPALQQATENLKKARD